MKKIRLGIVGGGGDSLIGVLHRIASNMHDNFQIVGGCFNPVWEDNIGFAQKIDIPTNRIYKDFDTLILKESKLDPSERMQVVSVLTPNFLHFGMAKKLIDNGFNVICEKPLTTSFEEAKILQHAIEKCSVVFALTHTYTGYPMVRQMRNMISEGVLGDIQKIDVQYYQGWINPIIHDEEKRTTIWRLDPSKSGISCCIGDVGTHAFNLVEYTTGLKIKTILSDLNYLYDNNPMDIDGTVLLRFSDKVKGVLRTSQIATGEENNFSINIYGKKGGLKWEQENPNYLYLLSEDKPIQVLKPGHSYNGEVSLGGTKLPPGHPEGIFDAMGNIYNGVAKAVRKQDYNPCEFPTLTDGVRGMNFVEKVVSSHKKGNVWLDI